MSDVLTKSLLTGHPGTPGTPASPGTPAYTTYTLVYEAIYSTPVYDPATGMYTYPPWDPNAPGNDIGIGTGPPAGYIPAPPNTGGAPVLVTYKQILIPLFHPAVPGDPGTAGTPPGPSDYYIGWNSGAASINSLTAPGEFLFSVPASDVGVVVGLSPIDSSGGAFRNIQWGLYFQSGVFQVIENGVLTTSTLTYTNTDVFAITLTSGVINYFQNTTHRYTSGVACPAPVTSYAAMYMGGDSIVNAAFSALDPLLGAVTATCAGNIPDLSGFSADNSFGPGGWANDNLIGLSGASTSSAYGNVAGNIPTLHGYAADNFFVEDCSGNLQTLAGHSDAGLLTPAYAICAGYFGGLHGFAYDNSSASPASCAGNLQGLSGFSLNSTANPGGWQTSDSLGGLHGWSTDNTIALVWFNGVGGHYSLNAFAHTDSDLRWGFYGTLTTDYNLVGYAGGIARITMSKSTLVASGTVTTLGEAYLSAPHYRLLATGTGTVIGRAYLVYGGDYSIRGLGGAYARLTGPRPLITAHGFGGAVGEAVLKLHRCTLVASGTQTAYGLVNGYLNGLSVEQDGQVKIHGPHFTIVAHGFNTATANYEAYSHTILDDKSVAVTRYTNYPFNQIVRFGSKYFGVATDGLFELTGNNFDGTPIMSVVQTGETDFSVPALKRARHLYLAGRLSQDLEVSVIARENETDIYTYAPVLGGSRSTRVPLGRGLQALYMAFKFKNLDGQDFELQELAPEVDELRRTA